MRDRKGYSAHTVRNYRSDLNQFLAFLAPEGDVNEIRVEDVDSSAIRDYVGSLFGRCKRTTIARKLSSVRSFFLFLEKRGVIEATPAGDIGTPKLGKYIPTYLPVDDMFRLLEGPSTDTPLGLRDLAVLEVLYSCGIRVSELEALDLSGIDFTERLVKVLGKGGKERIVPIGRRALEAVGNYLDATAHLRRGAGGGVSADQPLFINARGGAAFHSQHQATGQAICAQERSGPGCEPPFHEAFLRDAPARRGRRSAFGAGTAGACEPVHHAEIYPREP